MQIRHTASLLGAGKPVTIGYFGSSITEGYGASDPATTSWRARTTRYLRERFPGSAVTEINAAIGGTGSDLGAFRCSEDLLSKNPDLVFVEFAVNDHEADKDRSVPWRASFARYGAPACKQTSFSCTPR